MYICIIFITIKTVTLQVISIMQSHVLCQSQLYNHSVKPIHVRVNVSSYIQTKVYTQAIKHCKSVLGDYPNLPLTVRRDEPFLLLMEHQHIFQLTPSTSWETCVKCAANETVQCVGNCKHVESEGALPSIVLSQAARLRWETSNVLNLSCASDGP